MGNNRVKTQARRKRMCVVSNHAHEKLTERMDDTYAHLGPVKLGDLLDKDICELGDKYEAWFEEVYGEPTPTRVYKLAYFEGLHALVRDDIRDRPTVVTILTTDMVNASMSNGRWGRTPEDIGREGLRSSPFANITSIVDAVPAKEEETYWCEDCQGHHVCGTVHPPTQPSLSVVPDAPAPKEKKPVSPDDKMVVFWSSGDSPAHSKRLTRAEMVEHVRRLALNSSIDNDSIEVYLRQEVMIVVDVKVEVS